MILSYRHRFIFIKTNKAAGTSVEIALSEICGPDDVITPILEDRDGTVMRTVGPQNHRDFRPHMSLARVQNQVGEKIVDSFFKFCVVRNPWDRAVSFYFWRKGERSITFSEFIRTPAIEILAARGRDLYTLDGRPRMDFFVRFEQLNEDLQHVASTLGIGPISIPNAKSGVRPPASYRQHYRDGDAEIVRELCKEEIEQFNYSF